MVYDGTFVNVANSGSSSVTRIRASTGIVQDTIAVGPAPVALAFDGTLIYVAQGTGSFVSRFNATTGAELPRVNVGAGPHGLVYAPPFVYVSHANDSNGDVTGIWKIRTSTGATEGSPILYISKALAYDGTYVYAASGSGAARILASTGAFVEPQIVSHPGTDGSYDAMVFDGAYLYKSEGGLLGPFAPMRITRFNPNSFGTDNVSIRGFRGNVTALCFDGTYVYAASEYSIYDINTGMSTPVSGNVIRFQY
jgi:hypothetical protein